MSQPSPVGIIVDPRVAERQKTEHRVRLHTIDIPILRVIGMGLFSTGVPITDLLIRGEVAWGRWAGYAGVVLSYALISWLVLHLFYRRVRWIDLGLAFLVIDLVPWTLLIYASGGDRSWLFFTLIVRVADQTNTTVRRALVFAHLAVAAYVGMLLYLVAVDHHAVSWATESAKIVFLYGASLYIALAARPAERRRATTAAAVRMARESIAAMREHAAQLEEAKRAAEAANDAKTRFLTNVSHELRTPLNAIIGFAQLLRSRTDQVLTAKETVYAETILSSARHLLDLVTDVMNLSRIEMGRETLTLEHFAVADVARDAVAACALAARERSITLVVDVRSDVPTVHADRGRLKEVLVNLIANGIKFTEPGGHVTVEARLVNGDAADRARGWIHVSVTDTGVGVRPQDRERIFDAFEQAHSIFPRQYQGLGVGLALVRRLVELHGGRIWVESDGIPGYGSRFVFTLPVDRDGPRQTDGHGIDETTAAG